MKTTSSELKRAYKSYIQKQLPPSRDGCPSEESLFLLFDKSLPPRIKKEIVDHVFKCAYCLEEFEFFLRIHREKSEASIEISEWLRNEQRKAMAAGKKPIGWSIVSALWSRQRPLWRNAIISTAVLIIAAVLIVSLRTIFGPTLSGERGKQRAQARLVSPIHGKEAAHPLIFRWQEVSRAQFYQLEIFDETLLPLWKSPPIKDLHYELPPEAGLLIKEEKPYFWMVTAVFPGGEKKESQLARFTVQKAPTIR